MCGWGPGARLAVEFNVFDKKIKEYIKKAKNKNHTLRKHLTLINRASGVRLPKTPKVKNGL
jgi:hypothetical protein